MNRNNKHESKVIVIGLDGATWDVLNPMIGAGLMPNLKKLVEQGTSGVLISTFPFTSPTAWTSFMTGKNPGKHGIYSFERYPNHGVRGIPNNASMIRGATLWEILSKLDKTVGVFNVPMTFPPFPVKGFMISGLGTPDLKAEFTYPKDLYQRILSKVGHYNIDVYWGNYKGKVIKFLQDVKALTKQREQVFFYLWEEYNPDLFMTVFEGTDRVSHCLWSYLDPESGDETTLPKDYSKIRPLIENYYQQLDEILGKVLNRLDPNTNVLIMSDHGFGPLKKSIFLNKWLMELGLLTPRQTITGKMLRVVKRLGKFLPGLLKRTRIVGDISTEIKIEAIDFSKTKAYLRYENDIRINLKGRDLYGIVSQEEYEPLCKYITEKLYELRDPETGHQVVEKVLRREDVYTGDAIDYAPDLIIKMAEGYIAYKREIDVASVFELPSWRSGSGIHDPEGILIAVGPHVKRATKVEAAITDIAPTLLYMMDLPVPSDMDGRVLTEIFDEDFLKSNPPREVDLDAVDGRAARDYTEEESIQVQERLRNLGYL